MHDRSTTHSVLQTILVIALYVACIHCQARGNSPANSRSLSTPASQGPRRMAGDAPDDGEAECYVEVKQTRMVPGRCLPVGKRLMPHLCQTRDSKYIAIHNGCVSVLEAKSRKTRELHDMDMDVA